MKSHSQAGSAGPAYAAFGLVASHAAYQARQLYGVYRDAVSHRSRTPLLVRDHKSIPREKVMYQVGKVQNNVGGKIVLHTFYKNNAKDREVKQAFKLYRPVTFSQWTYNNYGMAVGDYTVPADLTNSVSGTLTTNRTNACLNVQFGFLNTGSNWATSGPNNNVMGLTDPATYGGSSGITSSLLGQAVAPSAITSGAALNSVGLGAINPLDSNFRYLLGPSTHTILLENMAPYMTDVEVYVLTPKFDDVSSPLALFISGTEDEDMAGAAAFFPKEDINIFENKPTHFRQFNENWRVLSKKAIRLAAGCNIEMQVRSKGWQKITYTMLNKQTPLMPGRSFFIMIRAKGPAGWVQNPPGGATDVQGIANIPVKLGYRIKETVSVLPCPLSVLKRARLKTNLQDFVSFDNVQFFNTATGQPTALNAVIAAASSVVGVPNALL